MSGDRFWGARPFLLIFVATLAVFPALFPGAELYLDNPSHLAEVEILRREILPEEHWFTGWSSAANLGFAVNQVNAPLVWAGLALLARLGLPVLGLYAAGVVASNVVFTLGAFRLGRRLLHDDHVAILGALFCAVSVNDLYGYAGAAAGMWPHRLANGILLFGLAALFPGAVPNAAVPKAAIPNTAIPNTAIPNTAIPNTAIPNSAAIGTWLAVVLLCHTYAGMAAAAMVALATGDALRRRDARTAGGYVAGAVLGALLSMPFWFPLLEPALHPSFSGGVRFWNLLDSFAWLVLPLNPVRLNNPLNYRYIGALWAFPIAAALCYGLWRVARQQDGHGGPGRNWRGRLSSLKSWSGEAWTALRVHPDPLPRLLLVFLGVLLAMVTTVVPMTEIEVLGPNPWRHLTLVRTAVTMIAAKGLATVLSPARANVLGVMGGLLAGAAGWVEMPVGREALRLRDALHAAWADAERVFAGGVVYHQNSNLNQRSPPDLFFSEAGALFGFYRSVPFTGTWYSISPIASEPYTRSENIAIFGRSYGHWADHPDLFRRRFDDFGISTVVTVESVLPNRLAEVDGFKKVSSHPPFSVWMVEDPDVRVLRGAFTAEILESRRGYLRASITDIKTPNFVFPQSWHPWWVATLDGAPVELEMLRGLGLVTGKVPGPGTLEIRWVDPTRWTGWGTGVGGILVAGLALGKRRRRGGGNRG